MSRWRRHPRYKPASPIPDRRTPEQIARTAHHEAGHAVVGLVLGIAINKLSIKMHGTTAGQCIVADPWQMLDRWEDAGKYRQPATAMRARAMIWLAGGVAEEEFFGSAGGDEDDRFNAACSIMDLAGDDRDAHWRYEHRLLANTRLLVRRHQSKIEALALAVLEENVMTEGRCGRYRDAAAPSSAASA